MLRVSLLGNLGADPELRSSQKGTPMTTFRVAVNQLRTAPDGERQEHTEWFRVRAMGRLADTTQRLAKGSRVLVAGRLDIGRYQSREGEARVSYDVWADEVVNLSARAAAADGEPEAELAVPGGRPAVAAGAANGSGPRAAASAPAEDLEDLPF